MKDYYARFNRTEKETIRLILFDAVDLGSKLAQNITSQLQGSPNQGTDWEVRMNRTENDYLWAVVEGVNPEHYESAILDRVLQQLCPPHSIHEPLQAGEDRQ